MKLYEKLSELNKFKKKYCKNLLHTPPSPTKNK